MGLGRLGDVNSRFTSNNGVTVNVSTADNLDDVVGLEGLGSGLLVTRDRGESLDDIVDRDGSRVSDTWS